MSIEDVAKKFAEQKRNEEIRNEVFLHRIKMLDEGLRLLLIEAEPLTELGIRIHKNEFLHIMTIEVQVETDGYKWWYKTLDKGRKQ
jgi:hypothetical protein